MKDTDTYSISSRGYFERARKSFSEGSKASLIHAILELRCAIEARLQEILDPHDHVPKNVKRTYKIDHLSKAISKNLCKENIGSTITVTDGDKTFVFRYIPVSSFLKKFAEKSGDYLHALKRPIDDESWAALRLETEKAIFALEENLTGNLLGPALRGTGDLCSLNIELENYRDSLPDFAKSAMDDDRRMILSVDYFEVL